MLVLAFALIVATLSINIATLLQVRALLAPRQRLLLLNEVCTMAIAMSDQMATKHRMPKDRRLSEALQYARELCASLRLSADDATLRKTIEAALSRR